MSDGYYRTPADYEHAVAAAVDAAEPAEHVTPWRSTEAELESRLNARVALGDELARAQGMGPALDCGPVDNYRGRMVDETEKQALLAAAEDAEMDGMIVVCVRAGRVFEAHTALSEDDRRVALGVVLSKLVSAEPLP